MKCGREITGFSFPLNAERTLQDVSGNFCSKMGLKAWFGGICTSCSKPILEQKSHQDIRSPHGYEGYTHGDSLYIVV